MKRRASVVVGAVLFTLFSAFGMASAAPANAPKAFYVNLECAPNAAGIDTITAIVMDNRGSWSPGHIVAINGDPAKMTGISLEFQGTVTDSNGNVVASFDQIKPGNRRGVQDTLQCAETESFVDDQGNAFTVTNTITLFIAPRG